MRTHMAFINEKRCTRVPMYSHGMRRSVHVQLTTARLHAYGAAEVAPLDVPTAMRGLSLSFERRYESMQAELEAFATQTLKARAPPLRLSSRRVPSEAAAADWPPSAPASMQNSPVSGSFSITLLFVLWPTTSKGIVTGSAVSCLGGRAKAGFFR